MPAGICWQSYDLLLNVALGAHTGLLLAVLETFLAQLFFPKSSGEGTKQYERFRDTIFLNYWAIVFVQDVDFFYFNIFLFVSLCDFSMFKLFIVLLYFFTIGYF